MFLFAKSVLLFLFIYSLALWANPATVPGVKLVRLVKLVKLFKLVKLVKLVKVVKIS